jgi:MFS family permease
MSVAGVYGSSFTQNISIYLFLYCVPNGIGCGMCYFVALICGWEHYPNRKGLVTGCILAGYGFSSFIFSLLSTKLVNPDGKDAEIPGPTPDVNFFEPVVADRVPYMIQTLCYIWVGLVTVATVLINRPDKLSDDVAFAAAKETSLVEPTGDTSEDDKYTPAANPSDLSADGEITKEP